MNNRPVIRDKDFNGRQCKCEHGRAKKESGERAFLECQRQGGTELSGTITQRFPVANGTMIVGKEEIFRAEIENCSIKASKSRRRPLGSVKGSGQGRSRSKTTKVTSTTDLNLSSQPVKDGLPTWGREGS